MATTAAVGMGQGAVGAVGMGKGISALPRRSAAPQPWSRAVERTLSFSLDNGGNGIRLETPLDR